MRLSCSSSQEPGCLIGILNTAVASGGPHIKPRRKITDQNDKSTYKPVQVTLDILHELEDFPLSSAAAKLGVSATAFKKASRKLGLKRWAYTKHGPHRNGDLRKSDLGLFEIPTRSSINEYVNMIRQKHCRPKTSESRVMYCDQQASEPVVESKGSLSFASWTVDRVCENRALGVIGTSHSFSIDENDRCEMSTCFLEPEELGLPKIFEEELEVDDEKALPLLSSIWAANV